MTINVGEPNEPVGRPGAATDRRRPAVLIVASVAAVAVLLATIVVLATRTTTVTSTVSAAEVIADDTPTTELTTDAGTAPPETTPETAPAPTEPPPDTPDAPINLPRPSMVLTGKTTGQIPVYTKPGGGVKVTLPNPRMINDDPNATVPLILLAKQQQGDWVEALIPVRPNGSTGWVRRSDFTTSTHDFRIEVRLNAFNLKVFNGDTLILNTGIGVATASAPTPGGLYFTTELLQPPNPNGPYGPYAFGLSGFSDTFTSFGGGPGQLGVHGTNQPSGIGQRVSSGCIRMRNQEITTLAKTLPLGVPVLVYKN
ncbi:MAG: L,D-transpeptidase [Actinobacteria bacterium]|nr:L,D-transpeptidase [Actinomycetota bacterium]